VTPAAHVESSDLFLASPISGGASGVSDEVSQESQMGSADTTPGSGGLDGITIAEGGSSYQGGFTEEGWNSGYEVFGDSPFAGVDASAGGGSGAGPVLPAPAAAVLGLMGLMGVMGRRRAKGEC